MVVHVWRMDEEAGENVVDEAHVGDIRNLRTPYADFLRHKGRFAKTEIKETLAQRFCHLSYTQELPFDVAPTCKP